MTAISKMLVSLLLSEYQKSACHDVARFRVALEKISVHQGLFCFVVSKSQNSKLNELHSESTLCFPDYSTELMLVSFPTVTSLEHFTQRYRVYGLYLCDCLQFGL